MQEYQNGQALITAIDTAAKLFAAEFDSISEQQKDTLVAGVDRSPAQMLAYQLGWLHLLQQWETDEKAGKAVVTPAPNYKWNQLGGLYASFYSQYEACSLAELKALFQAAVAETLVWVDSLSEQELFEPQARKWASSTPSNWPVWKWIHINTVAPFKTFRTKIRKWKKSSPES